MIMIALQILRISGNCLIEFANLNYGWHLENLCTVEVICISITNIINSSIDHRINSIFYIHNC